MGRRFRTWETSGLHYGKNYVALSSLTYEMLFVRFGLFARSAESNDVVRNAIGQVGVDAVPVAGARTLSTGPMVVASPPNSTGSRFYAMTQTLGTREVGTVRCAWEVTMNTGDAEATPAYQVSVDGVDWETPTAVPGGLPWYGSIGYYVGTFSSSLVSLIGDYRFIRFGVLVRTTDSSRDMMQVALRVDVRAP